MSEKPHEQSDAPDAVSPEQVRPVDLRDYVDFSPDEAVRVRVFATDTLTQDLWCIEPQQATPVLTYADADVSYTVIGGRSWFVTEEGEVGLDPMGSMLVPAGVVHGIDNRGADPLIVLASASPPDEPGAGPDEPVAAVAAAIRHDEGQPGTLAKLIRRALSGER